MATFVSLGACLLIGIFKAQQSSAQTGGANAKSSVQEAYAGLRQMMLHGSRIKFSLPAASSPTEPWGVVMDQGFEKGTLTTVATIDGSASLYFSNGGGFIGGKGQEPIRKAAEAATRVAKDFAEMMRPAVEFPLAASGQVTFYLMTDSGVLAAKASLADLRKGMGPFVPLWRAMEKITTEYRRWDQGGRKGGGGALVHEDPH